MGNKKSIKTYLFIIVVLAIGLIFGFVFGISGKKDDFVLLNRNLENSINQIDLRNIYICAKFEELYSLNPEKVGPWLHQAQTVRQEADELYNYIQYIKNKKAINEIVNLQEKLNAHTSFLLSLLEGKYGEYKILSYDNVKELYKMSPRAFVAALSKIQLDIKSNETEILQWLTNMIDINDYRVNEMCVVTLPEKTNIKLGETYRAQIVLAARDTTVHPDVRVNGESIKDPNGWYVVKPTSKGTFTYNGDMRFIAPNGEMCVFVFQSSYVVR